MSQSSRQFKVNAKFEYKNNPKSSLPSIDPFNKTKNKFSSPSQNKTSLINGIKAAQKNSVSKKTFNKAEEINSIIKKQISHNEPTFNFIQGIEKNTQRASDKQLMTTDSLYHPQGEVNIKQKDIKETQVQGFDMWTLNRNLKQFSQTRKLAFFKPKNSQQEKSEIQAPIEMLNKTKTLQIQSIYKVYGENKIKQKEPQSQNDLGIKKYYEPNMKIKLQTKQRIPNSTISNIKITSKLDSTLYGTLPIKKHRRIPNSTLYQNQKKTFSEPKFKAPQVSASYLNPYLRTFVNGSHLKRQPSNRNIQILQIRDITPKYIQKKESTQYQQNKTLNFRRNRFEKFLAEQNQSINHVQTLDNEIENSIRQKDLDQRQNENKQEQKERNIKKQQLCSQSKIIEDLNKQAEQKKRQYEYNKSIEKIKKSLLNCSDSYMEQYHILSTMPSSKIELYIDSINHPEFSAITTEYKSCFKGENLEQVGYNFLQKKIRKGEDKRIQQGEKEKKDNQCRSKKNINKAK